MPGVVVLAVKPQMMDDALSALPAFTSALFLSIAAGKSLSYFRAHLGERAAVVRAMPNTPAAIGRGMTVAVANVHVDAPSRELAEALLSAVGKCAWIEDEALMDAVTAVSGSGPAYVFYLAECLASAGIAAG
ncbi:pyrroline-5-carboxylate reductase, partial [Acidobacteria bacterium ACD]|nr:pyrroline-5-carboxylate reductase [Acidobacteria bacterium ACD]